MDARGDVRTNEELVEATASGLRWITYTRIVLEILMLGAMVVLARLIPPAAFGIFAVVVIVQELARSVPSEGIGSALVQRRSVGRSHVQAGLAVSLAIGTGLALATLVLAQIALDPLYGAETAELIMFASPCFLIGAVMAIPMATLRRRLDFARVSIIELVGTIVSLLVTLLLAVLGMDAAALVLGYLASMCVSLVVACFLAPPPLPRWRRKEIGDLLGYGGPAALASFAWAGFRNGDYAIISARLGSAQAGFYWRAYQLAVEYQRKISQVMTQMAFPVLARAAGREEMLQLRGRMVRVLTIVLFPLLVLLVLLAPVLVPWMFGPIWAPAVVPTQILAIGGALTLLDDAVGQALMAEGRTKALLGYGVGHFAVYAGAVVVVSPRGLTAVATAAAVVHGVFTFIAYQLMLGGRGGRALRGLWGDVSVAVVCCAALLVVAGPAAWALDRAGAPALVHLGAVGTIGMIVYAVALRLLFRAAFADIAAVLRRLMPAGGLRLLARMRAPFVPRRSSEPA